jgi:hypothetical protein
MEPRTSLTSRMRRSPPRESCRRCRYRTNSRCLPLLFASPGCFPFCPTRSLSRRDSFARRRGHRASFLRRPHSPGPSAHSSETSQGRQRHVQLLHFPLHALSFLPQLLDYSSQAPHGFPPRSSIVPAGENWMDSQIPFPNPKRQALAAACYGAELGSTVIPHSSSSHSGI